MSTLFVQVSGLIVQAHQASDAPSVVCADKRIIDVNLAAEALGVRIGMSDREGKTIVPELKSFEYVDKKCIELRNEWLDIATQYSDQIETIAPHAAYLDLARHPQPKEVARLFLDNLERKFAYPWRAGLSPTKWVAKALSGSPLREMALPGLSLARESTEILAPLAPETRQRLIFLGYKRVQDVQSIKLSTLNSQFGTEAHRINAVAHGGGHEPVIPNYPELEVTEKLRLDGGCLDRLGLQNALGDLSKRLFAQLVTKSLQAKDIELSLGLEDTKKLTQKSYAKPFRGAFGLQLALIQLLDELAPNEPIYSLIVRLPKLTRVPPKQRSLSGIPSGDASFTEDALESVRHKFGGYSVHLGKEHREPRRVHVLRAWSKATGWQ